MLARGIFAGDSPSNNDDNPGADVMFAKFDAHGNRLIDRVEFRAVARTMRASSCRR